MKKLAFLFILFCSVAGSSAYSQCNPDFIYSLLGIPGIWPDANTGINDATVYQKYDQTLTVIVPKDTTVDLADFGFPFSLEIPVNINSFTVDGITGLPSTFTFECASTNCIYNTGETGCLLIEGTADQSMSNQSYLLTINLTIGIDLNDYGLGDQSFPYDMTGYELYVRPSTSTIQEASSSELHFISIQTNQLAYYAREESECRLEVYDALGQKAYATIIQAQKGENRITLPLSYQSGIYLFSIFNAKQKIAIKTSLQLAN